MEKTQAKKKRRRGRSRRAQRGIAIFMVLAIVTILGAMAADLQNEASVNVQLAANARDQLQAEMHAKSALELELFLLRFQSVLKGSLAQFIPIPLFELSTYLVSSDTMKGLLTERKGEATDERKQSNWALGQKFGDFDGSFWVEEVVDENRKININRPPVTACLNMVHIVMAGLFADPKYDELFEHTGDSRDVTRNRLELISNITDWVDGNDTVDPVCTITGDQSTSGSGEDQRYRNLPYGAQYKPKNGQMSSLMELRMVPGVNDAFMQLFSNYFTVWTDDTGINLNTAEPVLMRAVITAMEPGGPQPGDEERFQKFMEEWSIMRVLPPPMNKLSKTAFLQLLQTAQFKIDQNIFSQLENQGVLRFDDTSMVYKITAVGRVGDVTSTVIAVWRDSPGGGDIRYYRQE
ncbi:MAG: type II secretion system protein GspK [Myxococcota bacterium]